MTKIIFSQCTTKICKIILSDEKMNEIIAARDFIINSKWQGEVKVPLDVIVYDINDDKDNNTWDSFASVFSTGAVDLRHEWYEGDESYLHYDKDLLDIKETVYFAPELIYNLLHPDTWRITAVDYKSFKKKASKNDIKLLNRELMKKKLEGDIEIVD